MKLSINKAHFPVTVLGYGRRIGIWTQGCGIGCKGCVSQDTLPSDPNKEMSVEQLLDWCQRVAPHDLDGLTISGGEPFEQAVALEQFLELFCNWKETHASQIDILCYTGLPYKKAMAEEYADLRARIDVLIPGPYVHSLDGITLRGSSNQSIVPLSELGMARYGALDDSSVLTEKRFQMTVDKNSVWLIGIPMRGDMQRVENRCRENGVIFNRASWHA